MKKIIYVVLIATVLAIGSIALFAQKGASCGTVDVQDTTGAEIFAVIDAGRQQGCLSFTVTSLDPAVGKNWRVAGN